MSTTLTEQDDTKGAEEELIPVDAPLEDADDHDGGDDGSDADDERLAQSEDDHDEDVTSSGNREKRRKRREMQRRAREAKDRDLVLLRETVAQLSQRLAATEQRTVSNDAQSLQQQYARAVASVEQAEAIIAKATEAGNGDDVVAAMRIRDQAISEASRLQQTYAQYEAAMKDAQTPKLDPSVVNYAKQWMDANPWYDPQGRDRDSALTKGIDNELIRDGFDPRNRDYWEELTARVADAFGEGGGTAGSSASSPRRKAPPTGNTREHAPRSTRKEIYVTPERKQAMIDAGVWDDPMQRQKYLRAYQDYDRNAAR